MKRSLSSLLMSVLFVSAAFAETYSAKTFLTPRSSGANSARTLTTWHNQIKEVNEDRFGGSLQANVWYSQSTNKKNLGKYFGSTSSRDFIWINSGEATSDLNGADLFHDGQGDADLTTGSAYSNAAVDKIQFRPDVRSWGVEVAYNQHLNKLLDGLSFRVSLPIEDVRTRMGISSLVTPVAATATAPVLAAATVQNFLAGKSVVTGQSALSSLKVDSNSHNKTGLADIDATLQYEVWAQDHHAIALNAAVVFPTGSKSTSEFLFEPRVGYGHWGVGAGLESHFRLWTGEEDTRLDLLVNANYRYLFSATEKRTPTVNNASLAFYHYGIVGSVAAATVLSPAANVLKGDYKVTPGSQVDAFAALSLGLGNWTLDAGYNLFFRAEEDAKRKTAWTDDAYGFVNYDVAAGAEVLLADIAAGYKLNAATIVNGSVETPGQLTHTVFGGVGYAFNEMETPVHLGLGGSYEFTSNNASVENWSVSGKVGVSF